MIPEHLGRLRILIQSQLDGGTVEMVFAGIRELTMREPAVEEAGEIFDVRLDVSSGQSIDKHRPVTFELGEAFRVVARRAFWRLRPKWLGPDPRLGDHVPAPGVIPAMPLPDNLRRCENCRHVWGNHRILSMCPGCGQLTELQI